MAPVDLTLTPEEEARCNEILGIKPDPTATEIKHAARTASDGHYGDHLTLINHVWYALGTSMTLNTFKALLLSLYIRGELTLAKADMPQTINQWDLAYSTVMDGDRRLVFVEV